MSSVILGETLGELFDCANFTRLRTFMHYSRSSCCRHIWCGCGEGRSEYHVKFSEISRYTTRSLCEGERPPTVILAIGGNIICRRFAKKYGCFRIHEKQESPPIGGTVRNATSLVPQPLSSIVLAITCSENVHA